MKQRSATHGLHRNFRFQPHWIPILILLTLMPVLNSCGESQPEKKLPSFQHFTQKEGLSSEMVYAITVQGEVVWFGTYGEGATLYNKESKTWKAYTTKGEPMEQMDDGDSIKWKNLLSYNHVSAILPDKDRIWFGTYFYGFGGGGISYYSPQSSPQWKKFTTNNGRAKKVVSMASDGESLWIGSKKALAFLTNNRLLMSAVAIHAKAGFTEVKSVVQPVLSGLGFSYEVSAGNHPAFVAGRCADVSVGGKRVGVFGEVTPATIEAFELKYPVTAFEIDLQALFCMRADAKPSAPCT